MITRIKLSNWRSHLDTELAFSRGVNALIGIMGSGKSSVTEAISFGLFGTSPLLHGKKLAIEEMISTRPKPQSRGSVEVEFVATGKRYTVRRVIEKGRTTEAELRQDGQLIESSTAAVTREVERILRLDYELFSKAVYSEQNGIDGFLRMPKGSRTEHIDRMLRLDRFEKAREGAVGLTNKIRQKREQLARLISQLETEGLEAKVAGIEKEIEGLTKEKARLLDEKAAISKSAARLTERLSVLEQKETELHRLEKDIERQRAALAEMQAMFNSKKKMDRDEMKKRIKVVVEEVAALEGEAKLLEGQIEAERARLAELNSRLGHITQSMANIGSLSAICPVCESPINSRTKEVLLRKRAEEHTEVKTEIEKVAASLKDKKARQAELSVLLKTKNSQKVSLEHEIGQAEEMARLEQRIKEYSERLVCLEQDKLELEKGFEGIDIRGLRAELHESVGKEKELAARIAGIDERIADKRSAALELRKRLDALHSYNKELAADEQAINSLTEFVKALRLTQAQLRDEFVKTVNWTMGQIWPELYPYNDFESVRLVYDDDYVLQLKETDREWRHVDGIASGGERSMACLALRIAFAHAFSPAFKWLIFDEPTHNLDAQAISQLSEILRDRIDQFAEQVFLITHEERLSEGLTGNIYRFERDKGRAGPTNIMAVGG